MNKVKQWQENHSTNSENKLTCIYHIHYNGIDSSKPNNINDQSESKTDLKDYKLHKKASN